jgi:prepilin-type N-terminal cleavage/methylation domain-containing protein
MSKLPRRGLSLLEVMLALAILGGSLAVLGQLVRIGARSAAVARDSTTAQLLAESKMAEIASGIILPETVFQEPADETGEWLCSVETQSIDQEGLLAVRVLVEQDPAYTTQPVTFLLTRWIVDPQVEADAKAAAAEVRKSAGANANQGQASAGGPSAAAQMGAGGAGGAGGFPGGGGGAGGGGGGPGPNRPNNPNRPNDPTRPTGPGSQPTDPQRPR